jgi:uncharacterized damage-inducible protein DinB
VRTISRPVAGEYAPYVVEYFDLVSDDVLDHMSSCLRTTVDFFEQIPTGVLSVPHEAGEWTIKQILQHISDDERIYAYRALRFARADFTPLPSFDQDAVAAASDADARSLSSLLSEYVSVRGATLSLFEGLPDSAFLRVGVANGSPMSVRAAAFHIAGHEAHHLDSIRANYEITSA